MGRELGHLMEGPIRSMATLGLFQRAGGALHVGDAVEGAPTAPAFRSRIVSSAPTQRSGRRGARAGCAVGDDGREGFGDHDARPLECEPG